MVGILVGCIDPYITPCTLRQQFQQSKGAEDEEKIKPNCGESQQYNTFYSIEEQQQHVCISNAAMTRPAHEKKQRFSAEHTNI